MYFFSDVRLLQAIDPRKDQTFFLAQIPQNALRKTMFPIGNMLKSEVKKIAHDIGLESIAQKRESTGICFVGKRNFRDFISDYVSESCGDFVDIDTGKIVTQHKGIHNYTIGQGISFGGQKGAFYTVRKMSDKRTILVALGRNHPTLLTDLFYTKQPHWINRSPFNGNVARASFRFQHGHKLKTCDLIERADGGLLVKLDDPVVAIAPGQFAVFYRNNECLGSAIIQSTGPQVRTVSGTDCENYDEVTLAKRIRREYTKEKETKQINDCDRIAKISNC